MSHNLGYATIPNHGMISETSYSQEQIILNRNHLVDDDVPLRPIPQLNDSLLNHNLPVYCGARKDSSGSWTTIKAYWLFLAHPLVCVLFVVGMMQFVHGRNFRPGNPGGSIFTLSYPLFQTQVNGLVSLGLVFARMLSTSCVASLIWTTIIVLLEKRGMTLSEISLLNDFQMPVLPRFKTAAQNRWLIWASLIIVFVWPSNFASPLANSSLAWNPGARDLGPPTQYRMKISPKSTKEFWILRAYEWQMKTLMESVSRAVSSPEYAFQAQDQVPLRRYFPRPQGMTTNSTMDLTLPYIDIKVSWIDASSKNLTAILRNTTYSDYVGTRQNGVSRVDGSIVIMMEKPWDRENDIPKGPSKYTEERLFAVKYNTWGSHDDLDSCPRTSKYLRNMPGLEPHFEKYQVEEHSWAGDCYQIGVAKLQTGLIQGVNCDISLIGSSDAAGTCNTTREFTAAKQDWIAPVATRMLSEIVKGFIMLGGTIPSQNYTVDHYISSVLTLAYHAAWSSVVVEMGQEEISTFRQAVPMVRASIDKGKLFGWFAMHSTVILATGLVCIALRFSNAKFVQDPTLTVLQLDISQVTHHRLANGLCNAATLSKDHKTLPPIKFKQESTDISIEGMLHSCELCQRRLVFVDKEGQPME